MDEIEAGALLEEVQERKAGRRLFKMLLFVVLVLVVAAAVPIVRGEEIIGFADVGIPAAALDEAFAIEAEHA